MPVDRYTRLPLEIILEIIGHRLTQELSSNLSNNAQVHRGVGYFALVVDLVGINRAVFRHVHNLLLQHHAIIAAEVCLHHLNIIPGAHCIPTSTRWP